MIMTDENILKNLNFERCSLIGVGVFGRVYKGYEKNERNKVKCIKIIPLEKFKEEEWNISQKLKGSENENVLMCDDMRILKDENLVVLLMEFVNGGDLKNYVDNHSEYFTENEILDIIKQICIFFFFFIFFYIFFIFFI
jgi:serine/threonine protein kinase